MKKRDAQAALDRTVGRGAVAVLAIIGLTILGYDAGEDFTAVPHTPHTQHWHKATPQESVQHRLHRQWELDQIGARR